MQNQAAEIKLRAERRAGELLAGTVRQGGPRKRFQPETFLPEGVSKLYSHRWQCEATVPKADFEAYVVERFRSFRCNPILAALCCAGALWRDDLPRHGIRGPAFRGSSRLDASCLQNPAMLM